MSCAGTEDSAFIEKAASLAGKSLGKLLRHGRALPGLLLAAHLPLLMLPVFRANPLAADFWIPPICVLLLLLFFLMRRSAGVVRWSSSQNLLLLADAICLILAAAIRDEAWAGLAGVFAIAAFTASHVDRMGRRHLGGLALLAWGAVGIPADSADAASRRAASAVTQFASNLAWQGNISNYREGESLHTVSTGVDIEQVLWNPCAWTSVFLMTLVWGVSRRRSVLQTLGLLTGMAVMFLLVSSLQTVWLLKGHSSVTLSSPVWTSAFLLPVYLGLLTSTDFFIDCLTSPIPVVARQGEAAAWDNPCIHFWNTLVAGFEMVPLKKFSTDSFRLPLTAVVLCLLILPVPALVLVTLSTATDTQVALQAVLERTE